MRGGIVALLALAVGLGVGYLLGASREASAPARAPASMPERLAPEVRPAGNTSLAQALRDLPLPAVERGSGTISGRVTRPDGTPVPGVTVSATLTPARTGPATPDLEEAVRKFVQEVQIRQMSRVEAVTDRDGSYTLSGLRDGRHDLAARLAGFRITPAGGAGTSQAQPGATLDFTAEPVVEVLFDVLLPDGSPAPDATITLKTGDDESRLSWRREEPRLPAPPGRHMCAAGRDEHDQRSAEVPLDVDEGAPAPTVVLKLEGRTGIRGTITFARDLPFRYAQVHALAFAGEEPPGPELLVDRGTQAWWQAADRRYAMDLPRGRYLVGVSLGDNVVRTRIVEVADRMEACDFVIETIDPSLYVVVRVLDPAGKPLSGISFDTGYRSESRSSSSSGDDAIPRSDGSYVVVNQDSGGDESGTWSVTAKSARYGERKVEYKAGETKELVVRFAEPAMLDLVVAGFAASEFGPTLLAALLPYPYGLDDWHALSGDDARMPDAEGRLALGPAAAGEYEVVVSVRAGSWDAGLIAATRRVTLAAGKNALSLPMPRLFSLVVLHAERKQGLAFVLTPECGRGFFSVRAETDAAGRARFGPLPEGCYQLAREGDEEGAMRVTVPGPAEIAFKPAPFNALRVTISEADGPWTKAGFMDGDLIVAVDGDEIESMGEAQEVYATLTEKEPLQLTVLRGGGRIGLRVSAKALFEGGAVGGGIDWATR